MIDISLGKELRQNFFWFKSDSKKDLRSETRKKIRLALESVVCLALVCEVITDLEGCIREVLIFNEKYSTF